MLSMKQVHLVGAGRAGCALGIALRASGWTVDAAWSRSEAGARRAERWLGMPVSYGFNTLEACVSGAEQVVLAVVDDAIVSMAERLAPCLGEEAVVVHMSGSRPGVEMKVPGMRAWCGAVHPLESLADPLGAVEQLRGAFLGLDGSERAVALGERMARDVGAHAVRLLGEQKALYHAGAVTAANHLVALMGSGIRMMELAGIEEAQGRAMLCRLAQGALSNLEGMRPEEALTGPARRGDVETVRGHLERLRAQAPVDARLYAAVLEETVEVAARAGLSVEKAAALRRVLEDEE